MEKINREIKGGEMEHETSYANILSRFNKLAETYASVLPENSFFSAISRAGQLLANDPGIQNRRIKGISSLPVDYTKEEIGAFLRNPYGNERPLRQTSEILRVTAYPYFKITKTYQDIPTYRYYTKPLYLEREEAESAEFLREARLLDKLSKVLSPAAYAHKIAGQTMTEGKVFYVPRISVDKSHNGIRYAFLQQLPSDYCTIVGRNNISGYTVSFNMMYFLQPGTDWRQFGDLFEPYLEDFAKMFEGDVPKKRTKRAVYNTERFCIKSGNDRLDFYPRNLVRDGAGEPRVFMQNGVWMYNVTLPADKVWTFEADDASPAVISPLSGLMLTYSQQSDYEAAQLSLLLNPLVKIFTGEIPYFNGNSTGKEDDYRLSQGGRLLFQSYFDRLMYENNTGGTAFFSAPVENIKSHDFAESANANEISESFNRYGMEKAGLAGLIPVTDDVKAAQVDSSCKIEGRFLTSVIYPQFCRMMNAVYESLGLRFDWEFVMFGDIFSEEKIREDAQKRIDMGDISAMFVLAALSGDSWLDKLSMVRAVSACGMMDEFEIPKTVYTQSGKESGRPKTEGVSSEAKEKAIDAGVTE